MYNLTVDNDASWRERQARIAQRAHYYDRRRAQHEIQGARMSDYRDYEIRMTYNNKISVSAIDEAEAINLAREIIAKELGQKLADNMTYRGTWVGAIHD